MAPDFTLYLATDSRLLGRRDLCQVVAEAVDSGVTVVQLRAKQSPGRELYELGSALHAVTRSRGVPLIINDRIDVMLALDAEGVHVGLEDLPLVRARALARGKIVGYSVNCLGDLEAAEQAGADYVGVGPVFPTATKSDARRVLGLNGLRAIAERARIPCVAIGGITADTAAAARRAGASGVCAISAILGRDDVAAAVREFRQKMVLPPQPALECGKATQLSARCDPQSGGVPPRKES